MLRVGNVLDVPSANGDITAMLLAAAPLWTAVSNRRGAANGDLVETATYDGHLDTYREMVGRAALVLDKPATALRVAGRLGMWTRIGLEDVLVLPDGSTAPDNAALVQAAQDRLADTDCPSRTGETSTA